VSWRVTALLTAGIAAFGLGIVALMLVSRPNRFLASDDAFVVIAAVTGYLASAALLTLAAFMLARRAVGRLQRDVEAV